MLKHRSGSKMVLVIFDLESSGDRSASFKPMIVPERQVIITEELDEKVIGLYGLGMSTRDITGHIGMYQMDISASIQSAITDKVIQGMNK